MLWWGKVRDRFPKFEQAPPLPPVVESFERPEASRPRVELKLLDASPTPRIFMVDQAESGLIQVQQDRFGYSWRKLKPEHPYPHYTSIRTKFLDELVEFEAFLDEEHLGRMVPTQCEVTYVNNILREGVWEQHGEMYKVIPSATPRLTENFLPMPEDVQMVSRYVIADSEGKPLARLYVHLEPRYLISGMEPVFLMRLTARGAPHGPGVEGLLKMMDLGHEWIVSGFTTLTSQEMHKAWGRTR